MNLKWLIVAILLIAVAASGCGDKGTTTEDQDEWCPVGTSFKMNNPETNEEVSWVYTGSEVIDGVKMCKAEFNTNNPTDNVVKIEWMWSEDNERVVWTHYDASGNVIFKQETKDGKTTFTDENGQVTEINTNMDA